MEVPKLYGSGCSRAPHLVLVMLRKCVTLSFWFRLSLFIVPSCGFPTQPRRRPVQLVFRPRACNGITRNGIRIPSMR